MTHAAQRPASFGLAGFAGYETGDRLRGPSLRFDAELPLMKDPSSVTVSMLASIGCSRRTGTWPTMDGGGYGGTGVVEVPVTLSTVTVVPTLRSTLRLGGHFALVSELGVGLFWATLEPTSANLETRRYRDVMTRIGAGCSYQVTDGWSVSPMLEFAWYRGGHVSDPQTFLAEVGALVRL